ncbi:thiopeptide-type bacteriocin biosynthesis protein [Streptomyces sp. NBC_00669]|uniref:thiopeptide-type bacteriocin biosynthesis protein n=1 Tax=Streptomyces sp. NBC_00669 TaxID=2976011 RepID=UPI002E2FE455|nr:thiopeptide-type bacteriocin biosynthesis protein [Streptomyces sp. NBC_00669]
MTESAAARDVDQAEEAVLAVLAGTPIEDAARHADIPTTHLAENLERYRAAGRAALETHPRGWHQLNIQFTRYPTAAASFHAHLLPALTTAPVSSWWFLRKHPQWRLRVHPAADAATEDAATHLAKALDRAVTRGAVKNWRHGPYEPETTAFGGPAGMALAHDLFHVDSAGILDYEHRTAQGQPGLPDAKTTSLLAMTLLMRAARLEFGEQGDVWAQVEQHRPLTANVPLDGIENMRTPLRRLLLTDADPLLTHGPLTSIRTWLDALQRSGAALANAAGEGQLALGLRGVLARHVLFHWNRMGFTTRQQSIWSRAAREAVLGP